ncbi:unnamed protein product [Sphagnum jensenii]|uniref:Uncharacterized protein n=1 Tax=Sphagnum jensenii TaxID=128206 RepID=A0ABP1AK71_9BRYO
MCGVADVAELRQRKTDLPRMEHEFDELRRRRRGGPGKNGLRIGRKSKLGGGGWVTRIAGWGTGHRATLTAVVGSRIRSWIRSLRRTR